ncbi:unnamed protein product [Allacma fusca]|uniref:Uncharacterized protein n=1 Tax=Allacma fusca TaxID=39272 RepID=A0A8J2L0V7_9HEXA|nr:unnamed protein product [Allacma fusca]
MSDLENDPIVMFHERYYDIFHVACVFILPTLIPCAAHLWGYRPYDTSMSSAENKLVAFLAVGAIFFLRIFFIMIFKCFPRLLQRSILQKSGCPLLQSPQNLHLLLQESLVAIVVFS